MKTVSYKDRYGAIVIETYLDYVESYEEGNVPKQMIDVNGTLVDSDKLYEIIYNADTRATVREAIKEQEILDERIKNAPWYLKPWGGIATVVLMVLIMSSIPFLSFIYEYDFDIEVIIAIIIVALMPAIVCIIKAKKYGITNEHYINIDNYEKERRKRFKKHFKRK